MSKEGRPIARLCAVNGRLIKSYLDSLAPRARRRPAMKLHQSLDRQRRALGFGGPANAGPTPRRDRPTVLPFLNGIGKLAELPGQAGQRIPKVENVLNSLHREDVISRDEISRQVGITDPVTMQYADGTLCPMGRGVSPARFKKEFCARVRVARISASYEPEQVAEMLGIPVDTWRRYELRTLLPHHMIPRVCALFSVPLDFFYRQDDQQKEVRRA
jgi:hypothetical protein